MKCNRVIALGFFDGVHLGHAALLAKTRKLADALSLPACAMSFDVHPAALISGQSVPLLGSTDDRSFLLHSRGDMDEVIFARFDRAMMTMPWQDFVRNYLVNELHAAHVVCGHDYRFGWHGEGDAELLRRECDALKIGCDVIGKVDLDGVTVSSTYIRSLLSAGDMANACRFLGHPHLVSGYAENGALPVSDGILLPTDGAYEAEIEGSSRRVEIRSGTLLLPEPQPSGFVRVWLNRSVCK